MGFYLLFLFLGGFVQQYRIAKDNYDLVQRGVVAEATVLRWEDRRINLGADDVYNLKILFVEFEAGDGELVEREVLGEFDTVFYDVGEVITVFYDPQNDKRVFLNEPAEFWAPARKAAVVMAVLLAGLLAVAFTAFFYRRRADAKAGSAG
jgi:hypothetical protein